ncbi:MAG: MinD/ParA family protein [Defluviitaleaceae bacterium]|nr:MinD/ParA family protein [Defluviitaleaceae bacterium]
MNDQANRLRDIIKAKNAAGVSDAAVVEDLINTPLTELLSSRRSADHTPKQHAKVITITSGKGGVGKTNFTVNLAIAMSRLGKRVVIIDADFGLANIEVLLGIIPKSSFADVFSQKRSIEDVITSGPMGMSFISGGSGLSNMANINNDQIQHIVENMEVLDSLADIVLIDTGAGISKSVTAFVLASSETIIVTTPEPTSITDAYAIIKTAREEMAHALNFKLIVNRVESREEGLEIYNKLNRVCSRFLSIDIENLGSIPYDHSLVRAVKAQTPVAVGFPEAPSTIAINEICQKILFGEAAQLVQKDGGDNAASGMKSFVKRLAGIFKNKA